MKEALKLALEALEVAEHFLEEYAASKYYFAHIAAITAIEEALAQPEQEPVEWGVDWGKDGNSVSIIKRLADGNIEVLAWEYSPHPPQPKEPEQEPVPAAMKTVIEAMQQDPDYAWGWHCNIAMSFVDAGGDHYTGNQGAARFMRTLANVEPAHELPFSPPQRTWVGLTDKEAHELWESTDSDDDWELMKRTEAKLKGKNT